MGSSGQKTKGLLAPIYQAYKNQLCAGAGAGAGWYIGVGTVLPGREEELVAGEPPQELLLLLTQGDPSG